MCSSKQIEHKYFYLCVVVRVQLGDKWSLLSSQWVFIRAAQYKCFSILFLSVLIVVLVTFEPLLSLRPLMVSALVKELAHRRSKLFPQL